MIRGARVLDPAEGVDAVPRRPHRRRDDHAARHRGRRERPPRHRRRGTRARARVRRPARPPAHARARGRGDDRDRHRGRGRRRLLRASSRCRTPIRSSTTPACSRPARAARARGGGAGRLLRGDHEGAARRRADRDGRARRRGRRRVHRRRAPGRRRRRDAPRAPVQHHHEAVRSRFTGRSRRSPTAATRTPASSPPSSASAPGPRSARA